MMTISHHTDARPTPNTPITSSQTSGDSIDSIDSIESNASASSDSEIELLSSSPRNIRQNINANAGLDSHLFVHGNNSSNNSNNTTATPSLPARTKTNLNANLNVNTLSSSNSNASSVDSEMELSTPSSSPRRTTSTAKGFELLKDILNGNDSHMFAEHERGIEDVEPKSSSPVSSVKSNTSVNSIAATATATIVGTIDATDLNVRLDRIELLLTKVFDQVTANANDITANNDRSRKRPQNTVDATDFPSPWNAEKHQAVNRALLKSQSRLERELLHSRKQAAVKQTSLRTQYLTEERALRKRGKSSSFVPRSFSMRQWLAHHAVIEPTKEAILSYEKERRINEERIFKRNQEQAIESRNGQMERLYEASEIRHKSFIKLLDSLYPA